ncbi:MAG: hypothetical protein V3R29_03575 [Candidatus Acidoferrales bacterium]|nr:hypothetical protein [Acidobacteriia bacterium AH_259_A11_L15]
MATVCCDPFDDALERSAVVKTAMNRIEDGRIVNEIYTEFFVRGGMEGRYDYLGINYCPFCGRAVSLGLWAAEKKK